MNIDGHYVHEKSRILLYLFIAKLRWTNHELLPLVIFMVVHWCWHSWIFSYNNIFLFCCHWTVMNSSRSYFAKFHEVCWGLCSWTATNIHYDDLSLLVLLNFEELIIRCYSWIFMGASIHEYSHTIMTNVCLICWTVMSSSWSKLAKPSWISMNFAFMNIIYLLRIPRSSTDMGHMLCRWSIYKLIW